MAKLWATSRNPRFGMLSIRFAWKLAKLEDILAFLEVSRIQWTWENWEFWWSKARPTNWTTSLIFAACSFFSASPSAATLICYYWGLVLPVPESCGDSNLQFARWNCCSNTCIWDRGKGVFWERNIRWNCFECQWVEFDLERILGLQLARLKYIEPDLLRNWESLNYFLDDFHLQFDPSEQVQDAVQLYATVLLAKSPKRTPESFICNNFLFLKENNSEQTLHPSLENKQK